MPFQLHVNILISASIYALVAASFAIIFSTVRFFHLAHGAIFTLGAYAAYTTLLLPLGNGGEALLVAACIGFSVAALSGVLIDRVAYRPLRRRHASDLVLLLASFGIFIFIQNAIALVFESKIRIISASPTQGYRVLGAAITPEQITIIGAALVLLILLPPLLRYTKVGKAMRAVADDRATASLVGVNPERIITFTFALGSALAGLAGVLVALETNLTPTMGFDPLLKGIIAVIIGGIGRIAGAFLGALFLGVIENLAIWLLPAGWQDVIVFTVFLLFLLFRPQGILGGVNVRPG